MSLKLKSKVKGPSSQDFELNIVPIIDCLTILVTFMLAAGVFIAMGVLSVGVAAGGAEVIPSEPPPIELTVAMKKGLNMNLRISGKENRNILIQASGGDWNFDVLGQELEAYKEKYPKIKDVTVEPQLSVTYQDVVRGMEVARKTHKNVLLGGF